MKQRHLFQSHYFKAALLTFLALALVAGSAPAAAPTISLAGPDASSITDKQQNFYHPFSNVTISDSDGSPVTVSILFSPTGPGSFHTPLPAGVSGSAGSFTIAKSAAAAATTTIRAIIYDPLENQIDIGSTAVVTFTFWAADTNGVNSTTNSDRTVTITPTNDPPTITGAAATTTTDKISVTPFSGVTLTDVDNRGTQPLSLTVVIDDTNKGGFNNFAALGFSQAFTNFTLSGAPNALGTAIRQLVFVPTENRLPVGLVETTAFRIIVDDSIVSATNATTTVAATSINDPPQLSGISATHQQVQTGGSISPFSAATISDVDQNDDTNRFGQSLTLTVQMTGPNIVGQLEGPGGFSGTAYTVSDVTPLEASSVLQGLIYRAPALPVSGTNTCGFTVRVTDGHGGEASNTLAAVDIFTLTAAPTISGTQTGQHVNDNTTIAPFASVTVSSSNGTPVTASIQLDNDAKGQLTNLVGFTKSTATTPATYSATGTSEQITAAMRTLLFQPTPNRLSGASNETTTLSIVLSSSGKTSPEDRTTTVIVAPVNDRPVIQGISPPATIQDTLTTHPFPVVSITDPDESNAQQQTVSVALDFPFNGSFDPASLSIFTATNNSYVAVGSPAVASTAIRQLVFVPKPGLVPVGLSTNVVFSITANDGYGGVTVNSATLIRVAAVSGAPSVNAPAQQPLSLAVASPLHPLGGVTIGGANTLTVTVQVSASAGAFSSNSLAAAQFANTAPGLYVFVGSASNATVSIQNLDFVTDTNLVAGSVIRFTITAADATPNSDTKTLDVKVRQTQRSWIVTKTTDYDTNAPDAAKFGTLRKAIEDASSNDHITFDLRSSDPSLPDYPTAIRLIRSIEINKNLTLDGPGADALAVSGEDTNGLPSVQIFTLDPNVHVTMHRITLTKGFDSFSGGAVEVNQGASLTLSYCAVTACTAGVWGGGIDVNSGQLSVDHCLIQGNSTSASLGLGGGGVSIFTDQDCSIVNTTFSRNLQLSPGGLGGGALYVENSDPGHEMDVVVTSCTFHDNTDAAGTATSIRPNQFDANVFVQNCIFADGQGHNLYLDGSGMVLSLGGNISDDSTRTIFSIGGVPYNIVILNSLQDQTNKLAGLLPLAGNGGPTLTFGLSGLSPALGAATSNETTATFFGTLGTDQRGFWRQDGHPDVGAFERNATNRIIIEEILFAPAAPSTNDEFIEFYVPRDSSPLNLLNYQVYVGGVWRHTFSSQVLSPGQPLVLFSQGAVTNVPSGVPFQVSSTKLLLDNSADTITLKNPATQTVFEVSYVGLFTSSDTSGANFLTNANQSIILSPQFQGAFLPYQLVAQKEGGPTGRTNSLSGPGVDVAGNSLGGGNFPPRAFDDLVATDAHNPLVSLSVLDNDLDLDVTDALRVVGVGVTNGFPSGAPGGIIPPGENSSNSISLLGAAVTIISNGASIIYDPRASFLLQSLPQDAVVLDYFQYTILDSSNGLDHSRGGSVVERSNNIARATATITVRVTGVNTAPTPQPDGLSPNPHFTTTEDTVLDFTTLDNLLANDVDVNTDDTNRLKIVAIHPTGIYSNTLQIVTALGATATLDIRFDPAQTHITYDPRSSAVLNSLSTNHSMVDTFYYSVMDTHGAIGSAAINITVRGINDVPTANADQLATDEVTPLSIPVGTLLGNDTDPDTSDILMLMSVTTPSLLGANVSFAGATVLYDPTVSINLNALARKEIANDSFTYVMMDGAGGFSTNRVTVVVTGVNDHPVAAPYAFGIDEDHLLSVPVSGVFSNSFDPDVNGLPPDDVNRILPFTNRLTAAGVPVTLNPDGSFAYDPRIVLDWLPVNSNLVDRFTYTLLDGSLTMANDDLFSVQGNTAANVLPVLANDVALAGTGGIIGITSVTLPDQGGAVTIDSSGKALSYTPAVDYSGPETFSYAIADGQGGTDTAKVTVLVSVNAINVNLVANPDSFTVARGTTVNLDVLANDNIAPASGRTLSILSVGSTSGGGIALINGTGNNNSITYTPNLANASPFTETFTYRISGGGTIQATGLVTVTAVTSLLTANDDNLTVLSGNGNTVLDVLSNDRILPGANTNLTIISVQQTNALTGFVAINSSATRLLYKPRIDVLNQQEPFFTYTIADGAGGLATGTVSVVVKQGGLFANDDLFTIVKNSQSNSLSVLVNDAILPNSGQTLAVTDTGLGADAPDHGGTVTILGGQTILYTPASNYFGAENFTYEISDGTVARARGHVRVMVLDTSVLQTSPDLFNVARDSASNPLDVLRNDFRVPRTPGTLTIKSVATTGLRGVVTLSSGSPGNFLIYTPAAGFIGTEIFSYACSDAYGNPGSNQVTVTVGALVTRSDLFSVLSDSANNQLDVLVNDVPIPDTSNVRRISGLGSPDRGGVVTTNASGTMVLYAPSNHFVGIEHFTYQISDDSGKAYTESVVVQVIRAGSDRDTNTVTVTVQGVNDPPTITGTQGGLHITDKQTILPFTNVTIADVDLFGLQPMTVKVILDNAAKGALQNLTLFTNGPPGTYTAVGLASNITVALRALVFVPVENRITVPTTETTRFTISADDFYVASPVLDTVTSVDVTAVNDPPVITGTLGGQRVYDRLTIRPFAGVTITEVDNLGLQPLNVTVSRDQPTHGFFATLGGFVLGTNGAYSLSGVTAAQASSALRGLVFVPTTGNRLSPGGSETNRMTITVNDGFAPAVVDNTTTVISVDSFIKTLAMSNLVSSASFGYAVSANRDMVLVGAPGDNGATNQSGAAYLLSRNLGGNDAWGQLRKLQANDGSRNDMFGFAVGLSGDTLVVGAPTSTNKIGAVYVFDRNTNGPNAWGQSKKLVPADGVNGDRFGVSVAISGDIIVVGAYLNRPGTPRSGAAYIFGRNQGGIGQWGLIKKLVPGDGADSDNFGISVAISGDTVVVGAQNSAGLAGVRPGSAYVFDRNQGGVNQWGFTKKIAAADGISGANFGHSVAITGDLILTGAPYDKTNSLRTGSAYVFGRNQGGTNQWGQLNKFLPFDGMDGDEFGYSVTIDGELMAVSSHLDYDSDDDELAGAVYVYARSYLGLNPWSLLEKLVPLHYDGDNDDAFVVSLSQGTLAVGAHFGSNSQQGKAFIYRLKFNNAPYVATPIPNQPAFVSTPFTFTLPDGIFADPDVGDNLTLSLSFFPPPPGWLNFNPATATFSGIPDLAGTYPIVVRPTDLDGASVTANFNIVVPGSVTVLKSVKALWRTTYFNAQVLADPTLESTLWGDTADPDGDGVSNLQEYLFGTNPLQADAGDASPVSIAPGLYPDTMSVTFRRRTNDSRLIYALETCNDFTSWQPVDASLVIEEAASSIASGLQQVTQQIQVPAPAELPQFFRLKATFLVPDLP